jgi:hypothetical protein
VISCDTISKVQNTISTFNIFNRGNIRSGFLEERRVMDISRIIFPVILSRFSDFQSIPSVSSFSDFTINFLELFRVKRSFSYFLNLFSSRPDISKENIFSLFILSDRGDFKIDINGTSKSI